MLPRGEYVDAMTGRRVHSFPSHQITRPRMQMMPQTVRSLGQQGLRLQDFESSDSDSEAAPEAASDVAEVAAAPNVAAPPWLNPGELTLPNDPGEILRRDAAAACDDSVGSDLWTLDQVSAQIPRTYRFAVPTFAPLRWPAAKAVSQAAYTECLHKLYPILATILPISNVHLIGPVALAPFDVQSGSSVADLAIVGIDAGDRAALWLKVAEVARRVRAATRGHAEMLSCGNVTFHISAMRGAGGNLLGLTRIRLWLCPYPSLAACLRAAAAPAAALAFDGSTTCMTALGAYAFVYRVNVVDPARRGASTDAALYQFWKSGVALAMPGLRRQLRRGQDCALGHFTLRPAVARGNFAAGTIDAPAALKHDWIGHDPENAWPWVASMCGGNHGMNVHHLAAGTERFGMPAAWNRRGARRGDPDAFGGNSRGLPFESYADGDPLLADVLPEAALDGALARYVAAVVDGCGCVGVAMLRRLFGMTDEQVGRFVGAVADHAPPFYAGFDASAALAPFCDRIRARYRARAERPGIEWWTAPAAPGACAETAQEWYGDGVKAEGGDEGVAEAKNGDRVEAEAETFIESLAGLHEAREGVGRVFDGECSLCHEGLTRGEANSLILGCGHIFHWRAIGEGCPSFLGWLQAGHNDCPVCRADFTAGGAPEPLELAGDEGAQPAAIHVDW